MQKIINWFKSLFGGLGEIWNAFKSSDAGNKIIVSLNDQSVQAEAMSLVRTLADTSVSPAEKEASFNQAFTAWLKANGYTFTASLINVIRELAYTAYQLNKSKAS